MEKIKIKLTYDQLDVINDIWEFIFKTVVNTTEQKVLFDIALRLSIKFKKKAIDKEFHHGEFNIRIHYFEAYFLSKVLQIYLSNLSFSENPYQYNVVLKIDNYLGQKLA
jgi:hypothetical protein